ncbi:hypothetical protein [Brucella intermedia]|uniref:hypothetical protein n=1 Tax=Brucella intermedia TaxID=94625 RepID=UPI0012FD4F55|nr:hypothetical protein [Brucella intermedia]WGG61230.1 hypothetical protein QA414_21315 [Brucella intermedia]
MIATLATAWSLPTSAKTGGEVAADLNARYVDTTPCPGGKAAYMCNGIVLRFTGYGPNFHAWNPSPEAIKRNGVSFVYLRSDLKRMNLNKAAKYEVPVGLISRALGAPAEHPFQMRCMYPTDGHTGERPDKCGIHQSNNPKSVPCAELGIADLSAWKANYAITGDDQQCSLGADGAAFDLSIQARTVLPKPFNKDSENWNEAVIAVWEQDIPTKLPFEAIFYMKDQLKGAQYIQKDFLKHTGRILPIVKLTENPGKKDLFSFSIHDQIEITD